MDNVKDFWDHSMSLRETTDNLLTSGHFWPPSPSPHLLGLTFQELFLPFLTYSKLALVLCMSSGELEMKIQTGIVSQNSEKRPSFKSLP